MFTVYNTTNQTISYSVRWTQNTSWDAWKPTTITPQTLHRHTSKGLEYAQIEFFANQFSASQRQRYNLSAGPSFGKNKEFPITYVFTQKGEQIEHNDRVNEDARHLEHYDGIDKKRYKCNDDG